MVDNLSKIYNLKENKSKLIDKSIPLVLFYIKQLEENHNIVCASQENNGLEILPLIESARMFNVEKDYIDKKIFTRRYLKEPLVLFLEPTIESLYQVYYNLNTFYKNDKRNITVLNPNLPLIDTKSELKTTKRIDILLSTPSYLMYLLKDQVLDISKVHNININSYEMITNSELRDNVFLFILDIINCK